MKPMYIAGFFFAMQWIVAVSTRIGYPASCCTKVTTTKVRVEQIVSYLHQDDIICPVKAVRFQLINGNEICSDPNDSWTKNAIKKINARKTTPPPKTPSTYGRKTTLSTSSPETSTGSTATMTTMKATSSMRPETSTGGTSTMTTPKATSSMRPETSTGGTSTATTPKATSSMHPETSTGGTSTTTTPKATSSMRPWTTTKMMTTTATNPSTTDSKTTHTTTLPSTSVTTTTPLTAWKKTAHAIHTSSTRTPSGKDNKPREWTTTTTTTSASTQITTTEMTTMTDKTPMPTSVTRENELNRTSRTSRTSPRITTSKPTPYTSPTASTKRLHGKIWTLMTTMQTATERKLVTTKPMTTKTSTKPMTAILQRPSRIKIRCPTSKPKSNGELPWTVRRLIKKKRKGLRRAQMNIECKD